MTIGVAVAALTLVGTTALAIAWKNGDGDSDDTAAAGTTSAAPPLPSPGAPGTEAAGTPPGAVPGGNEPVVPPGSPGPPSAPTATPLAGRTVVIDPGHNPGNSRHTRDIGRQVDAGGFKKNCDETGTQTDSGYTEAEFTLDVAHRTRDVLTGLGAKVVLTWDDDRPWGPCVDERARVGNEAHADAVVSIHGDGAGANAYGFHVIVPDSVHSGTADTRPIAVPSRALGDALVGAFAANTGSLPANYIGRNGIDVRDDLGGLNLSTVPKVFIECGNMRNAQEAARMSDPLWRQKAAQGIAFGIRDFLAKGS
ncbi:N-acetylmuramoyl-L-alanine amidase [Yinghuangia sp. ASG 101]|uniref:N-acetylmuramoyl-L-alanine amidase n=1 Tax=Yinghuangia sp. ASG 101 TaxID=2896848 RepID=UPI001E37E44F|nr:N-acetylmuramoyl-L-alanine amidase [Yinghuangia sp. ASG 101]UGQ14015.1 N-acetylmuramoyl-L-alanine amidase [Yinghuangia sp. ASG 101]